MTVLSDVQLARRLAWTFSQAPATCRHPRGFREPIDTCRVRKRCRRRGIKSEVAVRWPMATASERQCLNPVRRDLGYQTCASHWAREVAA
jgi:hypothetical protein